MSSESDLGFRQQNDGQSIPIMLVTANVGSLFEDPSRLLQPWIKEFLTKVSDSRPQFLALHLQEVGGKTYEKSMECVQNFIQCLCEASEMEDFIYIRIYMDEDFNSAEHFTALGNLYFVHKDIPSVRMWNFLTHGWESVDSKSIYSGNIETIPSKEKSKFPQHFFPECKWSRKGFMRTRWEINFTVFDLVNIHLFHDASNLAACEEFPSVYCKTRRRALVYTLERFHLDDKNGCAPYFLFGDFNFRCDTGGVIKELTENLTAHRVQSIKSDSTKVHYRNSVGNNVLTIGKKEFNYADHQLKFKESWLKKFDRELEVLNEILVEYPIEFPPSYPYEEDPEMPTDYMSTRCPSWCDRILMSPLAKDLIADQPSQNSYHMIGENVCMGDHKPIFLNIRLKQNQGTYRCCKCYINNIDNMRPSSIHRDHEETPVTVEPTDPLSCPYRSSMYREIVSDCNKAINQSQTIKEQNKKNASTPTRDPSETTSPPTHRTPQNDMEVAANSNNNNNTVMSPPVRINIFDTDNIYVCMCAQIAKETDDQIDGAICPECRNIIKKQPLEHRYRIVSKRLMLPNNIIVNRIDTQYLNAYSDSRRDRPDPYTPESAESHSPCPEFNNTSTSTSSSGHSPFDTAATTSQHSQQEAIERLEKTKLRNAVETADTVSAQESSKKEKQQLIRHERQRQQHENKGIVSPGQLKSRLEDLQRSCSLNDMDIDGDAVAAAAATGDNIDDKDDDDDDANYVDDICNLRTPTASVPENLRKIVHETLSEDAVWKEQAHVADGTEQNAATPSNPHSTIVSAKSQYVQINSMKPLYADGSAGAAQVQGSDEDDLTIALSPNCTTGAILKETTV